MGLSNGENPRFFQGFLHPEGQRPTFRGCHEAGLALRNRTRGLRDGCLILGQEVDPLACVLDNNLELAEVPHARLALGNGDDGC